MPAAATAGLVLCSLLLAGCNSPAVDLEACIDRGIAYYREIGSYPRLSDGHEAASVARELCKKTLAAF